MLLFEITVRFWKFCVVNSLFYLSGRPSHWCTVRGIDCLWCLLARLERRWLANIEGSRRLNQPENLVLTQSDGAVRYLGIVVTLPFFQTYSSRLRVHFVAYNRRQEFCQLCTEFRSTAPRAVLPFWLSCIFSIKNIFVISDANKITDHSREI